MARALIVGCGCRGRLLGATLLERGWAVRGTSRSEVGLAEIVAAGIEPAAADPNLPGTVLDLIGDVAVVHWLLGSAGGSRETVAAIHGSRLERLLERLVDTPVRGFVYESAGTVAPQLLEGGAEVVREASRRWRIPAEIVVSDPADSGEWAAKATEATERLSLRRTAPGYP